MIKIKRIIVEFIVVINIIAVLGCLCACSKKADVFSEEEHIQRVTERIEKRFMTDATAYTSFSVYPLYNENDELNYFLIEFEPYGFIYVMLRDEAPAIYSWFGFRTSMYSTSNYEDESGWSRYTIEETNNQPCYELDENGNRIYYKKSPFFVAEIGSERRYLLREHNDSSAYFVPAIKMNDEFINLVSTKEFTMNEGVFSQNQPNVYISFIADKAFDL